MNNICLNSLTHLYPLHSGFGENKELRKVIVRLSFVLYPGEMFIYVFSLKVIFDKCHVLTGFVLSFLLDWFTVEENLFTEETGTKKNNNLA